MSALTDKQIEGALTSLAEALESGLSLIAYLKDPATSRVLPPVIRDGLARDLEAGASVTTAFARLDLLTEAELSLVQAGERSGHLGSSLKAVAEAMAKRRANRWKVLAGLAYPTLLINMAGCITPLPLIFTKSFTAWLQIAIWAPLATLAGAVLLFVVLPRQRPSSPLRTVPIRIGLALPVIGGALRRGAHGTFAEILGRSIAAGLPMPISIQSAVTASGDPRLQQRLDAILDTLDAGGTLTEALEAAGQLHPSMLAAVAQAEATGTLDATLPRIAEQEREHARWVVRILIGVTVVLGFMLAFGIVAAGIIEGMGQYLQTIDRAIDQGR